MYSQYASVVYSAVYSSTPNACLVKIPCPFTGVPIAFPCPFTPPLISLSLVVLVVVDGLDMLLVAYNGVVVEEEATAAVMALAVVVTENGGGGLIRHTNDTVGKSGKKINLKPSLNNFINLVKLSTFRLLYEKCGLQSNIQSYKYDSLIGFAFEYVLLLSTKEVVEEVVEEVEEEVVGGGEVGMKL